MGTFYDNPIYVTYHFPAVDFGDSADITQVIAPMKDSNGIAMRGKVVGALIKRVTENFAGSTLDAGVQVGDGSDADKYYDSGRVLDETVDVGESVWLVDDGAQVDIEGGRTSITVTFNVTTGTPTGTADCDIVIGWY